MATVNSQNTNNINKLLQQATSCLQQGRLEEAQALSLKLLRLSPDSAAASHLLGLIAGQRGEYNQASNLIKTAIKNNPQNPLYHCSLALALEKGGHLEEALTAYAEAIHLKADYAEAYYSRGAILRELGRRVEAVEAYRRAILLQPEVAQLHVDLAFTLQELGRPRMALSAYERAIQLRPDDAEAQYNRGVILATLGRPRMALVAYDEAIRLKPDYAEAHNNRGTILKAMGRFEEATAAYERTLELRPDVAEIYENLAFVLNELGRTEEASKALMTGLSLNPGLANASYMLAAWGKEQVPEQSPRKYITELYDDYAKNFDSHLVETLGYKTPRNFFNVVTSHTGKARKLDILDLGCGTGLCGVAFSELCSQLVGVDLSPQMLAKARARNLYTDLIEADVSQAMEHIDQAFDLILAADVLIYIGNLDKIFSLAVDRLNPGGLFALSIEDNDSGEDYLLRQTGRYAHSPGYIQRLADSHGFEKLEHSHVTIRQEQEEPVAGSEFLLRLR